MILSTKGERSTSSSSTVAQGVCANYNAMKVGYRKMDKVFLNHLHGDHMSDLVHIYCFGPSGDRKSPLYVWGPSASGVKNPYPRTNL